MGGETQSEPMAQPAPDAELVGEALQGKTEAFEALVLRYYGPVSGLILKRVKRSAHVEDLVQETFLEAYRSLATVQTPSRFSSWLFGIALNRCGKWLRRKRPVLFSDTEPPEAAAPPSQDEELEEHGRLLASLENGLASLAPEIRQLVRMKHQEEKTCAEIAVALGQPIGTIKSQLSRAYKSLRVHMSRFPG